MQTLLLLVCYFYVHFRTYYISMTYDGKNRFVNILKKGNEPMNDKSDYQFLNK